MTAEVNIGLLRKRSGDFLAISFPYNPELINQVKRLDDRRWDPVNRRWITSLSSLQTVKELFPEAAISEGILEHQTMLTSQAENVKQDFKQVVEGIDLDKPLPNGKTLFQHQKESVLRMLKYRRQILALDMGLGKTLTALVTAKILNQKHCYKTIIICPVSLKETWQREALSIKLKNYEVYSWAKLPASPLEEFILIADESHYAQAGNKSQRGKAFLELAKSSFCIACYCLTGTPMKNGRPINLLPLLEAVKHSLAKDKRYYHIRYCDAHPTRFSKWDTNGAKNLDELNIKIKDGIIRRTKKECLDLPDKLRVMRKAEATEKSKQLYESALKELRQKFTERVNSGEIIGDAEALVMLNHVRHAGSIAKTETAIELAEEVIEEGGQIVIFTEFLRSAQIIFDRLSEQGIKCELLTGASKDRQAIVDRFQAGDSKVFIGTIKAGGVGITLTKAQTVILVDRPWTPGDAEQAEDRLHRIGQKGNVTAIWLQYDEVDENVDEILQAKSENIEIVLHGRKKKIKSGNIQEFAKEFMSSIINQK